MTARLHILVVDDDEALLDAITAALEDEDYLVTTHRDGYKALDWIYNNGTPNLVILDMRLPSMSGWTLWSRLRFLRDAAQLPVVITSGESGIRERVLSIGASGFLHKPFSLDQLLETVRFALETPPPEGLAPGPSMTDTR